MTDWQNHFCKSDIIVVINSAYKTSLNDSFTNLTNLDHQYQNLLTQSGHSVLKFDEGNIITE